LSIFLYSVYFATYQQESYETSLLDVIVSKQLLLSGNSIMTVSSNERKIEHFFIAEPKEAKQIIKEII